MNDKSQDSVDSHNPLHISTLA
ncbi:hypothetical protein NOVOSPHI9U_260180 [Novosphingobium sp. 9U]|nr:hypothetical protein NOVOSPHI9U_260180 [Novosphingobium sp. 9U]